MHYLVFQLEPAPIAKSSIILEVKPVSDNVPNDDWIIWTL